MLTGSELERTSSPSSAPRSNGAEGEMEMVPSWLGPQSQSLFMKRMITLWMLVVAGTWAHGDLLYSGLLEYQRLKFFPSDAVQNFWAVAWDLLLFNGLAVLFLLPLLRWLSILLMVLAGWLLLLMTIGGYGINANPMFFWLLLIWLPRTEKGFWRSWQVVRWIALIGTAGYGIYLCFFPGLAEFTYLTNFIPMPSVYLVFTAVALAAMKWPKWNNVLLAVFFLFALVHSIGFDHPFWSKTLIFVPFLNWTNLHRYFLHRFEPR
jgi:hypothetical protein